MPSLSNTPDEEAIVAETLGRFERRQVMRAGLRTGSFFSTLWARVVLRRQVEGTPPSGPPPRRSSHLGGSPPR